MQFKIPLQWVRILNTNFLITLHPALLCSSASPFFHAFSSPTHSTIVYIYKNCTTQTEKNPMCLFIYSIQYFKKFTGVSQPNVYRLYSEVISYVTENQVFYHYSKLIIFIKITAVYFKKCTNTHCLCQPLGAYSYVQSFER